ncbi:OLC1v1028923C2 [Oldenlandia corymbosa var. corymbosa]|uniref:Bidirectional sugar transporter SWEET n=1 Tax=Oldenlandia corymbosa var. corymbosa TaxID=529605 RepID=A0AAV1CE71_OLDCO|nr:OLC1v1028923C2 [Oldenlandia corymbosa var. corymbosa]
MVSSDTARTVVGIIGNAIAFFLFLSPVPTFIQICKKKSVQQYSPVPYLATFINCALWVLYGLPVVHPNSLLVITINGTGFAMEVVYLAIFLTYCNSKQRRIRLAVIVAVELVFVAALALGVLTLAHTTKTRSNIVGSICMAGNIMMYAAPLSVMKMVIKTKSVEYMPFFLSLASFANGVSWTAYALFKFDVFIFAPNSAGAVLGLVQLLLYAIYYRSTKRILAERRAQVELGIVEKPNGGSQPQHV